MSTLNITAQELDHLADLKDQGRIAEAWNLLGSKGDAYAFFRKIGDRPRFPLIFEVGNVVCPYYTYYTRPITHVDAVAGKYRLGDLQ